MANNITIQKFNNVFVSTMVGFLQELCDLPGIFVAIVVVSFVLYINILKEMV